MECTLYLSDNCNMRCKYCYESERTLKTNLDEKKIRLALRYIVNNNVIDDKISLLF